MSKIIHLYGPSPCHTYTTICGMNINAKYKTTPNKKEVTCKRCKKTKAFRRNKTMRHGNATVGVLLVTVIILFFIGVYYMRRADRLLECLKGNHVYNVQIVGGIVEWTPYDICPKCEQQIGKE